VALFFFFSPSVAFGHTSVVSTTPIYTSTLAQMPTQVSITFTDDLMEIGEKKVNTISITAPDNSEVKIAAITIEKNVIIAELPQDKFNDGTYVVTYRVVSADGHPVSGSYELYLNAPSAPVKSATAVEDEHGFLHVHQTHLIQAGVVLILIVLWWGYRRFNREAGE
jgi:copper transport protein